MELQPRGLAEISIGASSSCHLLAQSFLHPHDTCSSIRRDTVARLTKLGVYVAARLLAGKSAHRKERSPLNAARVTKEDGSGYQNIIHAHRLRY
jgi:hypothetical protein